MRHLCIIPARGGSKRIPRKNVKDFLGRPIIAYSISAALESGLFDEVMVSTDDVEIASVAAQYGASVPFMRSSDTANDFATTADVIAEVLERYAKQGQMFDTVTCLYATAPFVTAVRLREGYAKMEEGCFDSLFTVVAYSYPIQRSLTIDESKVSMLFPEHKNSRSQDLQTIYHDAGQFYISSVEVFKQTKSLWGMNTGALVLSELEVQDLDTETDWRLAEMKMKLMNG